ncbi:hypothetical protein G7Y89_g12745 [Cudoniella acicularis]|uniref:G domain-containing protein n=1 Tax=Cudoniella acicularis TaxID=354080 RepID=A0A8H4RAY2_9HELO|nr:hypothetical protein G7Y89_g12745 [Cudoniella acicularis]
MPNPVMRQHGEGSGSSSLLQAPLPTRPAPGASSATNENNDRNIRNAMQEGREISGTLADLLSQSSLADNRESNIHQVLSLAEELRNYQSPVEFTIGLVGDSGVGKSSLINSLLDREGLAKTSGNGRATTSVVTEYRKKRDTDNVDYTVEIERLGNREMDDLLRQSVLDYRRYHLRDQSDAEESESAEVEQLRLKAKLAWDTLTAVFSDRDECTEVRFQNAGIPTEEITRMVLGWKDRIIWPAAFNASTAVLTVDNAPDCADRIEEIMGEWMWPFIKVARIYLDTEVLHNGIVLVDLPGFRDVNSARVRVAEIRLYQCDEIFIVTGIGRAATNQGVEDLVVRQLGKNFNGLKRSQGVAIICTKSEDLGEPSDILRDVQHTNEFNPERMTSLQHQIEEAREEGEPWEDLAAMYEPRTLILWFMLTGDRRKGLFMSARNEHVKRHLQRHYAAQRRIRTISVFCVSNTLYNRATNERIRISESIRNRRRSFNIDDRNSAAEKKLQSSGIPELQNFVKRIPSESQVKETRHFLETRLLTLLEKTNMWLSASVPEMAASQPAAPGFVQELQSDLKTKFDTSVEKSHAELNHAKTQMLQRPLSPTPFRFTTSERSLQLRGGKEYVSKILVSTFRAFWNQDGAHATANKSWTNWNEEIIKAMVDDIQPTEELFRTESEKIFKTLSESTDQGLSALPLRLGEHRGVNNFTDTFPRRQRSLEYEIETVTDWFFDELQTIFHDLLRTHGTSYVMHCMKPIGDRNNPKLFKVIRDLFIAAMSALLDDTKDKFQEAVDKCYADIENDLELVRGEEAPPSNEEVLTGLLFDALDEAQRKREAVLREFEAGLRG